MRFIKSLLAVAALTVPGMALANDNVTTYRQITDMGCHTNASICYVTVAGDPVSPATGSGNCTSNSIRWNSQTANGKNILALLTAAFMAGKTVSFAIDGCLAEQTAYPTFGYISIR